METAPIPVQVADPVNTRILEVSEDQIQGFQRDPFAEISRLSGVEVEVVIERIKAMLAAGTIRRVRQTLLATNLAKGALVAWKVPTKQLDAAFETMFHQDPFTGHVVTRSTDTETAGSAYKLWTTLKVPQGFSMIKHCEQLLKMTGSERYRIMPAKRLFALGVGHMRRRNLQPGDKADDPAKAIPVQVATLSDLEWRVLTVLKREFTVDELKRDVWSARAEEAELPLESFCEVAENLNERKVIGRFSTFLEHVKTLKTGEKVTRFNALFHWAVPEGREIEAGGEVGRHLCMTHAYWRQGGPEFNHVNIMGVSHGTEKETVLAHKAAIDEHLKSCGIPLSYTNVFWGGRSEIKPSEISPYIYLDWCREHKIDPESLKETQS